MTLPQLIFWIVLSALLLAFGLLIILSACKAAGRNPLAGGGVESIDTLVPSLGGIQDGRNIQVRGGHASPPANLDTGRGKPRQDQVAISGPSDPPASHSLSSIGTGLATAQVPHPRVTAPGNSASELLHADARKISSRSKSAMAPALTGRIIGCHSWPTLKSSQPHRLVLQASKPALAHLISIGGTIRRMA